LYHKNENIPNEPAKLAKGSKEGSGYQNLEFGNNSKCLYRKKIFQDGRLKQNLRITILAGCSGAFLQSKDWGRNRRLGQSGLQSAFQDSQGNRESCLEKQQGIQKRKQSKPKHQKTKNKTNKKNC